MIDGWTERSRNAVVELAEEDGALVLRSTDRLVYRRHPLHQHRPASGRPAGGRPAAVADERGAGRFADPAAGDAGAVVAGDRGADRVLRRLRRVQRPSGDPGGAVRRGPLATAGAPLRAAGRAARPPGRGPAGRQPRTDRGDQAADASSRPGLPRAAVGSGDRGGPRSPGGQDRGHLEHAAADRSGAGRHGARRSRPGRGRHGRIEPAGRRRGAGGRDPRRACRAGGAGPGYRRSSSGHR